MPARLGRNILREAIVWTESRVVDVYRYWRQRRVDIDSQMALIVSTVLSLPALRMCPQLEGLTGSLYKGQTGPPFESSQLRLPHPSRFSKGGNPDVSGHTKFAARRLFIGDVKGLPVGA